MLVSLLVCGLLCALALFGWGGMKSLLWLLNTFMLVVILTLNKKITAMHDFKNMAQALRFLSIDAVEKAQSGHPGMPMGMADVATVLWHQFCDIIHKTHTGLTEIDSFYPTVTVSMLLYALLHLTGYDVTIDDIKQFRQLGSNTPGHPEYGVTPGVEALTGPLGQGASQCGWYGYCRASDGANI